jgi:hypothetical protein
MRWLSLLSCFFGGLFLANAAPHWISGITGRPFPTPFAKPPGRGLSSPIVNVCWGLFNAVIGYYLLSHPGHFQIHSTRDLAAAGLGLLLISLFSAKHFGGVHQDQ